MMLRTVLGGDIHIWDRESSVLLHSFRPQDMEGDLTCIAWNHSAFPFMFSTGSHDGAVRIWTTPTADHNYHSNMLSVTRLNIPSGNNSPRPLSYVSDPIERTESPTTQEEFVSLSGHASKTSLHPVVVTTEYWQNGQIS